MLHNERLSRGYGKTKKSNIHGINMSGTRYLMDYICRCIVRLLLLAVLRKAGASSLAVITPNPLHPLAAWDMVLYISYDISSCSHHVPTLLAWVCAPPHSDPTYDLRAISACYRLASLLSFHPQPRFTFTPETFHKFQPRFGILFGAQPRVHLDYDSNGWYAVSYTHLTLPTKA